MATLTYDPSETKEGELNEEEQNSLEVGEKLAEQQNELLAGKFQNAEELEKGYIELQKKLGDSNSESTESNEEPEAKQEEEEKPDDIDSSFLNTLWDEGVKGEYTKETVEKLQEMSSTEIAQMYLKERAEQPEQAKLTEGNVKELQGIVGGESEYTEMMKWAGDNLAKGEVEMYDAVMDRGDPLAAFFAVQALAYRFNDARGVDGEMLQGKAATSEGSSFRSQAEVVKAMSDPRYEKDPAYRQDIYDKLERSDINF